VNFKPTSMAYQSVNPYTRQIMDTFQTITDGELINKLKKAELAFDNWSKTSFPERAELLNNAAILLEKEKAKHAGIITSEMGKPIRQSTAEVEKCAWLCRYYAENGEKFLKPLKLKSTARESEVWFEPSGVIFAIMPWNFPYWQVFRFLVPNLLAGNTGLLKHASNVPRCGIAIEDLILQSGAPDRIFMNLFIDYSQVQTIISYPAVQGVTLTGSNDAGYKTAALAGKFGKKSVLELGGSDPYIVFESADLQKSSETAILARFQNNGQSCIAAKRFFIQDTIFDHFLDLFKNAVLKIKTGNPMDPDTLLGPVAREDLLIELEEQLELIKESGGKIITGGKRASPGSQILEPTIIIDLPKDSRVLDQELFGPIIPIFRFNSEEEAIQLSNDTPYGLAASIWTGDEGQARRVASCLKTGMVTINSMVKSEPALPFGGVKASGYGRELSEFGIREFVNIKTVSFY
jgi:succinate-semialdehyde dehydrogenase/glutarate-semialdehyde dehydrogenase